MLIWIQEPSATIGIFTVVLLMGIVSTVRTEKSTVSFIEIVTAAALQENGEWSTVQVNQLPFAQSVLQPCETEKSISASTVQGHRSRFALEFYTFVSFYAARYKEDAQRLLNDEYPYNCARQDIMDLPNTPTFESLMNMTTEEAINSIYTALIFHSTYSFFVHHQFETSAISCSEDANIDRIRGVNFLNLGKKEKTLACAIGVSSSLLGYTIQEDRSLINETLSELTLCSRRVLRDCQVLSSTIHLLDAVSNFASRS